MNNSITVFDTENKEQQTAYELIANTNQCLFITGRAGTGKTTFMNRVLETVNKNFVVLAPTGKAAMLLGGKTIHSFFQFDYTTVTPRTIGNIKPDYNIKMVDTIIIDEVSMLRCDILDAIDNTLRHTLHTPLPFGGKQVIFCGDLYQLPPIVDKRNHAVCTMLMDEYGTNDLFFHKAHVFEYMRLPKIEFKKVYRQEDERFLSILDHIRNGQYVPEDIAILNSRSVEPTKEDEPYIILSGRNDKVDQINCEHLEAIDAPEFVYRAEVTGEFDTEKNAPVEKELKLKEGAQVMFCRNDSNGRWVNGSLGTVKSLENNKIVVTIEGELDVEVEPASWENCENTYDREKKSMTREVKGVYVQFPLKLAWAITIHKSQGATFERMLLDISEGGIFADGQLYVALSRARSLGGLFVNGLILPHHIKVNSDVKAFAKEFNDEEFIQTEIQYGAEMKKAQGIDEKGKVYVRKACHFISIKRYDDAYNTIKMFFKHMISDGPYINMTSKCELVPSTEHHAHFINAFICYFSNRYNEAIKHAEGEIGKCNDSDMHYIKARSEEMNGLHTDADITYSCYAEACAKTYDMKTCFALALHNEIFMGDPGMSLLQFVIKHTQYEQAILSLRTLMRSKVMELVTNGELTNPIAMAFNSDASDDTLVSMMHNECDKNDMKEFVRIIGKQIFE